MNKRFDIATTPASESIRHGLPSNDRLRGLDDTHLRKLSAVTGVSIDDLVEIRNLEIEHNPPKPYIY